MFYSQGIVVLLAMLCLIQFSAATSCKDYRINVHQTWVVTEADTDFYNPGSSLRGAQVSYANRRYSILVNNSFPGPVLKVKLGDWVRIDVYNQLLNTAVSIHWHGIEQRGTPWSDGTPLVSSCPVDSMISGGSASYTYIWQATKAGTTWWHGHAGQEHAYGVKGSIVVIDPNDPMKPLFDSELPRPFEVMEWWRSPNTQWSQRTSYGFFGSIEGLNINGFYSDNTPAHNKTVVATLQQGLCYRLRFINTNSDVEGWQASLTDPAGMDVSMTMIAVDGNNIKPLTVKSFYWYTGGRVDTVLCADGPVGDYTLRMGSVEHVGNCKWIQGCQNVTYSTIRVVERMRGPSSVNRSLFDKFSKYDIVDVLSNWTLLHPYTAQPPPTKASETWNLYMGSVATGGNTLWTSLVPFVMPSAPYLYTKGTCGATNLTLVKKVPKLGTVVDIIITNVNTKMHVVHLHGADFWVMGQGYFTRAGYANSAYDQTLCPGNWLGSDPRNASDGTGGTWGCPYNATRDFNSLNFKDPYITDSAPVGGLGWIYIRVKLDNPGAWFMHCHMNHHMFSGMGFIIDVAPDQQPAIPSWVNTRCGGSCVPAVDQECGAFSPPPSTLKKQTCQRPTPGYGYCTGNSRPAGYPFASMTMNR